MKKTTREEFIEKAVMVHGDKNYDYSHVSYSNSLTRVEVICPIHGLFLVRPQDHLQKSICPECTKDGRYDFLKGNNYNLMSQEDVIKGFIDTHGNKYDYSKVDYKNMRTKVTIICKEHGEFSQFPHHHKAGRGCRLCANKIINVNNNKGYSQSQFIEIIKAKNIPNLTFEKIVYKSKRQKVVVTCSIHGEYTTNAEMLLKGNGCPKCIYSVGEHKTEEILKKLNVNFEIQKSFKSLIFIKSLKFDFYLPNYNACIEFDGKQHYESISYYGGEEGFKQLQLKDAIKNEYCRLNNIPLLRIKFDDSDVENKIKLFLQRIQ